MNIADIIGKYAGNKNTRLISNCIAAGKPVRVHIKNMTGSADAFVACAVQSEVRGSQLFILTDKEEAAYFYNNVENITGAGKVMFFPSSFKRAYQVEEVDNANVLLRAEVLNRIRKTQGELMIVTYPEALTEKVVTRQTLVNNIIDLKLDEQLTIESLTDFLNDYEFEPTDFVYEAGQFAVRGGIVDVFSYANELPYRIEFADDRIGSIRTFDPTTQTRVENMASITIIPNVQTRLLKESRESIFEFIHPSTTVWIKDWAETLLQVQTQYDKAVESYQPEEGLIKHLTPEELFINKKKLAEVVQKFLSVEFGRKFTGQPELVVEYNTTPQPSFNKNFNLLIENLQQFTAQGYTNFIFADAAKQVERIYAIFEDIGQDVKMVPIGLSIHEGFIDHEMKLVCYTDHQVFDRYHRFRLRQQYTKRESITLKELGNLQPGDYVTHVDHGVGRFAGLHTIDVNGKPQEAIKLVYKDKDQLFVSIHSLHRIGKYSGKEGKEPVLSKLGSNTWNTLKQKTKKKVKDIARDLILLYAKRKAQKGFAFTPDTYLQNELEASFIYEDTPDQEKSTADVKRDMEQPHPMDRLVCGDVGFGKTEIAIRAAFKAVCDSKQVAVLVPTTILALQHYNTFRERLRDLPCTVDYINRFKSSKQQKDTLARLAEGKVDIIIGTHRLFSKDVKFKELGLLIIDEEQKFGVASKEKLKALRVNVDSLTLTATPIPRTLHFSLMGARDLSIINTPPPNRVPVTTELHTFNEELIRDAVIYEVTRGGQVFFVHNRVQDIHEMAGLVQRLCPDVKVGVGHGQMDGDQLEDVLMRFIDGEYDVLVATTIIESGLDIANANTIFINNAHHFGLSDLHQIRGRVGRSNKKAFCYLMAPPLSVLTAEARQRLRAIEEFSDLGSGFNIAMRDLDIRGAGNLLGAEQSGFIAEIGFDMYQKILDEAVRELKAEEFTDLFNDNNQSDEGRALTSQTFASDCQIDTDLEILIPDWYVTSVTERLSLYKELDNLETEESLTQFADNLVDRFGELPVQVKELMQAIRMRWAARKLGLEKIILKNQKLIGYFISNQSSAYFNSPVFAAVLQFVKDHHHQCKLKENKNRLSITFSGVKSIQNACFILDQMSLQPVEQTTK